MSVFSQIFLRRLEFWSDDTFLRIWHRISRIMLNLIAAAVIFEMKFLLRYHVYNVYVCLQYPHKNQLVDTANQKIIYIFISHYHKL